jgi:hypothetical protein
MPKAYLEFNLPEENEEFKLANEGLKYSCCIDSIKEHLRRLRKYEDKEVCNIEELENLIYEELED